jgi:hypothetical protein
MMFAGSATVSFAGALDAGVKKYVILAFGSAVSVCGFVWGLWSLFWIPRETD